METCDSVFLLLFGPGPREKGTGIILPAWLKVTLYLDQHNEQSSAHALLGDRQHTATSTVFYNFTKLFVRVSGWSWPKLHQLHLIISKQEINNSMTDIVLFSTSAKNNTESTIISSSKDSVFKVHTPCIYPFFIFAYLFCVQGVCTHMPQGMCGGQRTSCRCWFDPSVMEFWWWNSGPGAWPPHCPNICMRWPN